MVIKTIKYLLAYLIGVLLLVTLIFAKDTLVDEPQNSDASDNLHLSLLNGDLIFATAYGKNYTVNDLFGRDRSRLEQEIYDILQRGLYDVIKSIHAAKLKDSDYTPAEAEIEKFYRDNNLQSRGSLDDFRFQISSFLREQKEEQLLDELLTQDVVEKKVVIHQLPPRILVTFVNPTKVVAGDKNAKVAVIEFSDLQCPFCKKAQGVLNELIENYGSKVGFYFRHFPLTIHQDAFTAAMALECSLEQGGYQTYKAKLFEYQNQLKKDDLITYFKEIPGIDLARFNACLDSEKYRFTVEADLQQGQDLGVTGTPTFFIGKIDYTSGEFAGEALVGAQDYQSFANKLNAYLNAP